eukprot:m.272924 g.272924  ORF g.272924 m.272924 type:complete len:80 (-) comp92299_c0_seq1:118-357(-)
MVLLEMQCFFAVDLFVHSLLEAIMGVGLQHTNFFCFLLAHQVKMCETITPLLSPPIGFILAVLCQVVIFFSGEPRAIGI